jgi:hypothetical protein
MIVERNTFRLKFGHAKEAIAIWKTILEEGSKTQMRAPEMRLLSDLSGDSYTIVFEMQINSMIDLNQKQAIWVTTQRFQELYQKFLPLCEGSQREFLKIEAEV